MELTKEYFKQKLAEGVAPTSLADELAKMLNEAQDEYNAEKAKQDSQEQDLATLYEDVKNYITNYYGEEKANKLGLNQEVNLKELAEGIDSLIKLFDSFDDLKITLSDTLKEPKKASDKTKNKTSNAYSFSDVFEDLLDLFEG